MLPVTTLAAKKLRLTCVIAALGAIAPALAIAGELACDGPAMVAPRSDASFDRVKSYAPVFRQCRNGSGAVRLATRSMIVDDDDMMLMVDPAGLTTSLEHAACWTCEDTSDQAQADTRYSRAVESAAAHRPIVKTSAAAPHSTWLRNAGLAHGTGEGAYITGDLCPSRQPLDRTFLQSLEAPGRATPIALSISGLWLVHHAADFEWLREQERSGALAITWVNHSWDHPYDPTKPIESTFLLKAGVDMDDEISKTERLLIAWGETPSVFFRFPGLISDPELMDTLRRYHLIALGADGWLVLSPALRDGSIVLVHPNGNEPLGLRMFANLNRDKKLPRPFRPIEEAP